MRAGYVSVVDKAGVSEEIPFGACVWATGIAMNPLVKQLQEVLPGQTHFRCVGGVCAGGGVVGGAKGGRQAARGGGGDRRASLESPAPQTAPLPAGAGGGWAAAAAAKGPAHEY